MEKAKNSLLERDQSIYNLIAGTAKLKAFEAMIDLNIPSLLREKPHSANEIIDRCNLEHTRGIIISIIIIIMIIITIITIIIIMSRVEVFAFTCIMVSLLLSLLLSFLS